LNDEEEFLEEKPRKNAFMDDGRLSTLRKTVSLILLLLMEVVYQDGKQSDVGYYQKPIEK